MSCMPGFCAQSVASSGEESGSALIIDLARGSYFVCGSLVDEGTIVRFLEGWREGALDSFDVGVVNRDELFREEEHGKLPHHMQEKMVVSPDPWQLPMPCPMPGIVIWLPSLAHARSGESPSTLFKAFLHYAVRRCPREDRH